MCLSSEEFLDIQATIECRFTRKPALNNKSSKYEQAHGHDDISIRMIKICDESLLKPLLILFKNSLQLSCYPDIWKKPNIIPAHKKNDKQLLNN